MNFDKCLDVILDFCEKDSYMSSISIRAYLNSKPGFGNTTYRRLFLKKIYVISDDLKKVIDLINEYKHNKSGTLLKVYEEYHENYFGKKPIYE